MDTTPNTDLFIERFARAVDRLRHFQNLGWSNDNFIVQFMRAQEEDVLFLQWHLIGAYKTLPSPNKVMYRGRFPDVLKYVLSQPMISYRDIGIELWRLSPNIDELKKYIQIFKTKLNNAITWFPQKLSLDDVIFGNNPYTNAVRKAQADGYLPKKDAEYILINVFKIISSIHQIRDSIKQMFEEYLEMAGGTLQGSKAILKSQHFFSVNKSYEVMQRILTALQQQRFVSTNTKIEEFYYRMTGNGEPVQGRICWVKKAKNKAISLTSLIDFLVSIGVELESALSQVDDVFCREDGSNIKLPDDTKTTARNKNRQNQDLSAYHQVIKTIIDEE